MPNIIKTNSKKNIVKDVIEKSDLGVDYNTIQPLPTRGLDFKTANIDRIEPSSSNVSIQDIKVETVAGGRVKAIKGPIGPEISVTAGEALSKGDAVQVFTDSKAYKTDSLIAATAELFDGFVTADVAAGGTAIVQLVGFGEFFTGLTVGSPYYLQDGTIEDQASILGTSGTLQVYNDGSFDVRFHQRFDTSANMVLATTLEFTLRKVGSPTGNVDVNIYAVSGSDPTGGSLKLVTSIDASTLSSSSDTTFQLDLSLLLDASTTYTIEFMDDDSGTMNSTNRVLMQQVGSGTYAARTTTNGGTSWSSAGTAGNFILRRGLGAIGTTPGSYSKKAGKAISSTILNIINN